MLIDEVNTIYNSIFKILLASVCYNAVTGMVCGRDLSWKIPKLDFLDKNFLIMNLEVL